MSPSVHLRRDNRVRRAKFRQFIPQTREQLAVSRRELCGLGRTNGLAQGSDQKFGNEDRVAALSVGQQDVEDR
jgi:hypothetical protein